MSRDIIKRYSNGEITVVWQPSLCVHSGICARGLPKVFDPRRRPWVILDGFDTETIVESSRALPVGSAVDRARHDQSHRKLWREDDKSARRDDFAPRRSRDESPLQYSTRFP